MNPSLTHDKRFAMSKFTFILGLAGSGKSHLAKEMKQKDKDLLIIDDAFHPVFNKNIYEINLDKLRQAVNNGFNAVIIEGAFCFKEFRDQMVPYLESLFPQVEFEWICFVKDIEKAKKNLHRSDREGRNSEEHEKLNENLNPKYTYPDNCQIIPIFNE